MHCYTRRHPVRLVLLILFLAGLVTLLVGCNRSRNSSLSGSERITVSVEQAAAVLSTQSAAAEMYSGGPQGRAASTAQQVGEWLRKQGGVAGVEVSEDGTIWVEYSCGPLAVILPPSTGAGPEIWNDAPSPAGSAAAESAGTTQRGAAPPDLTPTSRGVASSDLTPTSKRAAVFAFDEYRRPSGDLRLALRQAGYTLDDKDVFVGEAFTIESLRSLSEYGVVYFHTHGNSMNTKGGYTILCTGVEANAEVIHNAWEEFVGDVRYVVQHVVRVMHGIGVVTIPGTTPAENYLVITNRFLYLNGIELQNALVIANACWSSKNADMAESFLGAGAALYVGWTNLSDSSHAEPTSAGLIRALGTPGTTFADAWSTKAIVLPGWTQAYSAAELFPMVKLKNSNGDGSWAYVFRNGVRWGDPADAGAEFASSLVYTPQGNAERFVLVPRSSGTTPKLSIAGGDLPGGQVSTPYSTSLSATGGVALLSWRVTSGTLPGGLGLDGTSGAISGTPTKTGTSTFSVEVSDTSSPKQTAAAQFSIAVSSGAVEPSRTGEDLSGGQVGASSSYSSAGYTILVWRETSDSNTGRICASRVDRDGRVLDETPIEIAKAGERGFSDPSVCFGANSWLVTWLEQGSETRIRAARVGPDGTVYDKTGFDVGTGCDEQSFDTDYRPSVAWVGSGWLVMYGVDAGRNDVALAATLVGEDGNVLTPEPMQWGRTATRGSVLFETIDSVRALEDSPFCVPGRSGYAILADIFITDRVATYWGAPRINVVAGSGVSVSDGWFTLQDEGQYRPASGDSIYDIAGCFGLTRWLVTWSIENYTRGVNDARLAMLESAESGARIVFVRTLAEQESWHPVGLSIAAPGDKDEWFVTWIAERPRGSGRDIVGTVVNAEGEVGQPRVIMPLFSSGDEYDSGNGVATAWNGQKYIVAHAAEIDAKPTQILVTCVTADGSPGAQTATIELQGRVSVVAAACDKAIPAPQVTFEPVTSVPGSDSPTPGVYLAPLDPRMCLVLREDGALAIGTLNEDGTGFEDADQGRWTRSGDEITLDLSAPYSGIHGRIVHDGLVFAEERQISALGLFSVVWVREGAPAPLDLGFRWQRVGGDSRERLTLDNNVYELSILNSMTDYLGSYTGSFTWDGRTARLKTPWYDADVITWNYVYLDGRLYYWNMDSVGIWECIDASLTTPGAPSSAAAPGSSTAATPATTPTVSTTPATTPVRPTTTPPSTTPTAPTTSTTPARPTTTPATTPATTPVVKPATTPTIPVTPAPVTPAPVTPAPVTQSPVTPAPVTQSPVTPATRPLPPIAPVPSSATTPATTPAVKPATTPATTPATPAPVTPAPVTPASPTTPMTSVPPIATPKTPAPAALPVDNYMARIPAGSFQMGDSFGDGYSDELPVHTVAVSAFTMDRYEITKALWDEVATWAATNGYDIGPEDGSGKAADQPVYGVSWYEAVKWANARSEKRGLAPCYTVDGTVYRAGENDPVCNWSANGYRLPTEAEWEKAARGGVEGHRFPWSDTDTIQRTLANYYSSSDYGYDTSPARGYDPDVDADSMPNTSPVGSFESNGYGLYDMAGNVWEWCWDWYGELYYVSSPGSDPRGPASGSGRVGRGGSWFYYAFHCRVANRNYGWANIESFYLGFRLVRTAPVPLSATTPATTPAAPTTPTTSVPPTATLTTPAPAALPVDDSMATIPAGSFQMGDSFGEGESDELPVRTVAVSAFTMDRYEITKALWDDVAAWAAANGYDIGPEDGSDKAADHPGHNVTWYEAVKWANARSEKEGLEPCYTVDGVVYRTEESDSPVCNWSANGYRLPTEAEWEKAARGGAAGHRFPWSDIDTLDHTRANYSSGGASYDTNPTRGYHPDYDNDPWPYTSSVGSFAPNGYGLYDMAGNVWEWCWDWYDDYASSPGSDPRGPASGSDRAIRGGGWDSLADNCRVASRYDLWPDYGFYALGFRLVRTAP